MDTHTNTTDDCARIAELVDGYVSGELDGADREIVERHLADCARCAADVALVERTRRRLRDALAADPDAPEILLARVRSAVRSDAVRTRRTRLLRFAAAAAVAVAASAVAWSAHDASPAPLVATRAADSAAPVLRVGLDHHLHCTGTAPVSEQALASAAIDAKLGAGYEGLAETVAARLGAGLTLVDAHLCSSNGRRYVHLELRRESGPAVSVLATRRDASLVDVPDDASLDERGARAAAYENASYVVFVVSGDPSVDPSAIAATLGPVVGPVAPLARV